MEKNKKISKIDVKPFTTKISGNVKTPPIFRERLKSLVKRGEGAALGRSLFVGRSMISQWMNGPNKDGDPDKIPDAGQLYHLAIELNVSVDYLLGLSDDPEIRMRPSQDEINDLRKPSKE